jgi:hypothetical protein
MMQLLGADGAKIAAETVLGMSGILGKRESTDTLVQGYRSPEDLLGKAGCSRN